MMRSILLAMVALFASANSASAFTLAFSQPASAEVVQFVCTFPKAHIWDGKPDNKPFVLKFSLDTVTNKAFTGNQGIEDVTVVSGDSGLTFLERLMIGEVRTTTVSKSGKSIHRRHTLMGDHIVYVGQCIVTGIIQSYIGPDHRVMYMQSFYRVLVQALHEAHQRGWQDRAEAEERAGPL
jgi:hypothetical protein